MKDRLIEALDKLAESGVNSIMVFNTLSLYEMPISDLKEFTSDAQVYLLSRPITRRYFGVYDFNILVSKGEKLLYVRLDLPPVMRVYRKRVVKREIDPTTMAKAEEEISNSWK